MTYKPGLPISADNAMPVAEVGNNTVFKPGQFVSEANPLPVKTVTGAGAFKAGLPVSDTNPMPVASTGGGGNAPSIAFAQDVAMNEGTGGGSTAFVFTLNLTRNGYTGAVPYTYAATGTGTNPAAASDFVSGAFPSGSGTFAPGETTKSITANVLADSNVEPNENFLMTATATFSSAATATGTIINDDIDAPPTTLTAQSRPNTFDITSAGNAWGDSTTFGVAAPIAGTAGATRTGDIVSRMRAQVTSGPSASPFHPNRTATAVTAANYYGAGGQSGQNTDYIATNVEYCANNYPTEMSQRIQFFSGGLNDYNTGVPGFARDWPAQVKANFARMAATAANSPDYFFDLAPLESSNHPGKTQSADHSFHRKDMMATYGRRSVDQARHLRFRRELELGTSFPFPGTLGVPATATADELALRWGVIPFSCRGYPSTSGDFVDGDPVPTQVSTAPANGSAGTSGALQWVTGSGTFYRCGDGGFQPCDVKHQGFYGDDRLAMMRRDMHAASEGKGPPHLPPQEFRITSDAAANSAVGSLVFTNNTAVAGAPSFEIGDLLGNVSSLFNINIMGQITVKPGAALADGVYTVVVVAKNTKGARWSVVDVHVGRASTATAPAMKTVAAPGVTIAARWAHGLGSASGGSTTGVSFVFYGRPDTLASTLGMINTSRTANNPLYVQAQTSGKLRVYSMNAAGTLSLYDTVSATAAVVGQAAFWFVTVDSTAGTITVYKNDTNLPVAVASGNQGPPSGTLLLGDSNPILLAIGAGNMGLEPTSPWLGGFGLAAVIDAPIDFSVDANRRSFMNADGSPAVRTPYAAIGGTGVKPKIEAWGNSLGDLIWGSPDGTYGPHTTAISNQARNRLT